jgi:hypothetical protein
MANFTAALAETTETPEALAVMSVLGIISVVAAKRFVVCPIDGWREPVNIYMAVILPPGNNKSFVLNNALSPLIKWEREQAEIIGPEIKRQWSERKSQEKLIESMRSKMAKERDTLTRQAMIEEIADLEASLIEPEVLPQVFCNDATPEALTTNVYEQGGRFALFSDEGGIIETMSGLYSGGHANVDIFLKGIDGGHVRVRRGNRNFDLNPFLTFVLCVQPIVLQNMAAKKSFRGNGSLERFIYAIPKSNLGYRTHDKQPISEPIRHAYHRRVGELLEIPPIKDNVGTEQPRILTLALDAFRDWREFQAAIEVQLRPGGRLELCQGWGGKISGYALRLAGLLHIAEHGQSNLVITGTTMANALELAALLTEHALAAFQLMGTDESTDDAKELYKWIVTNPKESFTQSNFSYAMRNRKQGKQDRLQKAITILIDRIILSEPETVKAGNAKKPTTFYRVNPAILKGRI